MLVQPTDTIRLCRANKYCNAWTIELVRTDDESITLLEYPVPYDEASVLYEHLLERLSVESNQAVHYISTTE